MSTQSIKKQVLDRIYGRGRGWVLTPNDFLDLGGHDTIRQVLKQLCDRGTLRRLARGVYDYPRQHPKLGLLTPTPDQIARAISRKDRSLLQPAGAYAANLLGLSEQVPAKAVFLTDAMDRRVQIGKQQIVFKRTTPKNMATAGRISGLVIQALRYLGRDHVDDRVIATLDRRLSDDDRQQLAKDARYAPAWVAKIMRQLAAGNDEGKLSTSG